MLWFVGDMFAAASIFPPGMFFPYEAKELLFGSVVAFILICALREASLRPLVTICESKNKKLITDC